MRNEWAIVSTIILKTIEWRTTKIMLWNFFACTNWQTLIISWEWSDEVINLCVLLVWGGRGSRMSRFNPKSMTHIRFHVISLVVQNSMPERQVMNLEFLFFFSSLFLSVFLVCARFVFSFVLKSLQRKETNGFRFNDFPLNVYTLTFLMTIGMTHKQFTLHRNTIVFRFDSFRFFFFRQRKKQKKNR